MDAIGPWVQMLVPLLATGVMGLIFGFSDNEIEPGK